MTAKTIRLCLAIAAGLALTQSALAAGPTLRDRLMRDMKPAAMLEKEREFFGLAEKSGDEAARGAFLPSMQWPPSIKKLRVCFFGGSEEARQAIRDIASEWETPDNSIRFDWGKKAFRNCEEAVQKRTMHIRIGFDEPGWYSYYGVWALFMVDQNTKSMNLGGFADKSRDEIMTGRGGWNAGTIRHEFGHAIGLIHEHQSPKSSCEEDFDWDVIYAEFAKATDGDEGWPKEKVDDQLRRWTDPDIVSTRFDPRSLMKYYYSPEMFKNGTKSACYTEGDNNEFSELDRKTASYLYPAAEQARVERYEAARAAFAGALDRLDEEGASKSVSTDFRALLLQEAPVDGGEDE